MLIIMTTTAMKQITIRLKQQNKTVMVIVIRSKVEPNENNSDDGHNDQNTNSNIARRILTPVA